MSDWMLPFLWIANGVLALCWMLVDHLWVVLLIPALGYIVLQAPSNQRLWSLAVAMLSLLAGAISPVPVALLLLLIAIVGIVAVRLEKLNQQHTHWTLVRGLGLYSLIGLGYTAYRTMLVPVMTDPALVQGQVYLSAIASIALYMFPVGVLVIMLQGLFVHPPVDGKADEIIYRFRARGKP